MNYHKLLQCILDIGEEMLVAGAEVNRVENSIERMCEAYGCDRVNVFIITSNIQVTMEAPDGEIVTQIRRILRNAANFDRIDYLNDLSRYICREKPDIDTIIEKYEAVLNRKQYPKWFYIFGAVLAVVCFTNFFGGNAMDCVVAAVVSTLMMLVIEFLGRIENNSLALTFAVSFMAGVLAAFFVHFGIGQHLDKISIGCIMILIPGVALTNAIRDMLIGDIASGVLRLLNSILITLAIACGFALALLLTGGLIS